MMRGNAHGASLAPSAVASPNDPPCGNVPQRLPQARWRRKVLWGRAKMDVQGELAYMESTSTAIDCYSLARLATVLSVSSSSRGPLQSYQYYRMFPIIARRIPCTVIDPRLSDGVTGRRLSKSQQRLVRSQLAQPPPYPPLEPVKALFPPPIPPRFPVLARACLWCSVARMWRVNPP